MRLWNPPVGLPCPRAWRSLLRSCARSAVVMARPKSPIITWSSLPARHLLPASCLISKTRMWITAHSPSLGAERRALNAGPHIDNILTTRHGAWTPYLTEHSQPLCLCAQCRPREWPPSPLPADKPASRSAPSFASIAADAPCGPGFPRSGALCRNTLCARTHLKDRMGGLA